MGQLAEKLFEWLYRVERLAPDDPQVAFRIAFQTHKRAPLTLSDGVRIDRGTLVAELHMRNDLLADLHRQHDDAQRVAVAYMRLMRRTLETLARAWHEDPRFDGVVAVYGVNLFPEHAVRGGFDARDVDPPWRRRLLSWHIRRIVAAAHPQGRARVLEDGRLREVMEVWLSRQKCRELYGQERCDPQPQGHRPP